MSETPLRESDSNRDMCAPHRMTKECDEANRKYNAWTANRLHPLLSGTGPTTKKPTQRNLTRLYPRRPQRRSRLQGCL